MKSMRGLRCAVPRWAVIVGAAFGAAGAWVDAWAGDFVHAPLQPTLDKLMYPFAPDGGTRGIAYTFGSFDSRFDTRDAQVLLGWDLAGSGVPAGLKPSRYLVRSLRISVQVVSDFSFEYDPTHDVAWTYATNAPGYVKDADLGRPAEIFGAAFRNGFASETFKETSPFGFVGSFTASNIAIQSRNAYAAAFGAEGGLIDVANNVGQVNPAYTNGTFEIAPWAVGRARDVEPGQRVPFGTWLDFDLDLADPLVAGYVQSGLSEGRLRFFLTSLHPAAQSGFGGGGAYPYWSLRENLLGDPPRLEVMGTAVMDADADGNGLPDDWERFYFTSVGIHPGADADGDGVSNADEWSDGTDPTRAASALRILGMRWTASGATFRVPVIPGRRHEVETSADLRSWRVAFGRMSYPGDGTVEWVEEDPTMPPMAPVARFYRVVTSD